MRTHLRQFQIFASKHCQEFFYLTTLPESCYLRQLHAIHVYTHRVLRLCFASWCEVKLSSITSSMTKAKTWGRAQHPWAISIPNHAHTSIFKRPELQVRFVDGLCIVKHVYVYGCIFTGQQGVRQQALKSTSTRPSGTDPIEGNVRSLKPSSSSAASHESKSMSLMALWLKTLIDRWLNVT